MNAFHITHLIDLFIVCFSQAPSHCSFSNSLYTNDLDKPDFLLSRMILTEGSDYEVTCM